MPSCKAICCRGNWKAGKTHGKISYSQFPNPKTERKPAKAWLKNISTGYNINTLKFSRDDVICSHCSHENCFEADMKAKLLGYEPKRRTLKPRALPTIFKHKVFHIINMNDETAEGIRSRKRIQINEQRGVHFLSH